MWIQKRWIFLVLVPGLILVGGYLQPVFWPKRDAVVVVTRMELPVSKSAGWE